MRLMIGRQNVVLQYAECRNKVEIQNGYCQSTKDELKNLVWSSRQLSRRHLGRSVRDGPPRACGVWLMSLHSVGFGFCFLRGVRNVHTISTQVVGLLFPSCLQSHNIFTSSSLIAKDGCGQGVLHGA